MKKLKKSLVMTLAATALLLTGCRALVEETQSALLSLSTQKTSAPTSSSAPYAEGGENRSLRIQMNCHLLYV